MKQALLYAFLLLSLVNYHHALKGSVILDSLNFDKVVQKFKFSLIKFDISYPYGPKHEQFGLVAENLKNNDDVLVGEVGIQDFGEMENKDIAERFQVKKDDYPVVILFKKDDKPVRFSASDEFTADKIKQFVRKETGIKIVLDNCLPEFDELAEKFVNEKSSADEQKKLIQSATEKMSTLSPNERKYADVYVKIMEKMFDKGSNFAEQESERVNKILQGKLTATKKKDLEGRLNILQSFLKGLDDAKEEL